MVRELACLTRSSCTSFFHPTDPVVLSFDRDTYNVMEGESVNALVVANRPFVTGPFQVTVRSQDGTAICMFNCEQCFFLTQILSLSHWCDC